MDMKKLKAVFNRAKEAFDQPNPTLIAYVAAKAACEADLRQKGYPILAKIMKYAPMPVMF